jgi:hypothetical protein
VAGVGVQLQVIAYLRVQAIEGDVVKRQREEMHRVDGSSETAKRGSSVVNEPVLDRDAIAGLAYYCWEPRGCPNDSPDEGRFRAETILATDWLYPQLYAPKGT